DQLVTFRRGDERQRDSRITARRLDDHRVLLQNAALLGVLDHGHANAVFDTAQRVEEFALQQDRRRHTVGYFVQAHEGRAAHSLDNIIVYASHNTSLVIYPDLGFS